MCEHGCYFLEKGGKVSRWYCERGDCEGHVYSGVVKKDDNGVSSNSNEGHSWSRQDETVQTILIWLRKNDED
jgi:hypothetical protein